MERELDVILFGATGFVGRLIAAELVRTAPDPGRIGIAGRDAERLHAVAVALGRPDMPQVVVDAFDEEGLRALARRTRVLLTVVGPYSRYGMAAARACAHEGTHYCDLNGEVDFGRALLRDLDGVAKGTGASLVISCGFDSVPSDLGVLLAADAAERAGAGELLTTTLHVRELAGGLSGGTLASMRTQLDPARKDERGRGDVYALSPDRDAEPEPRGRHDSTVWFERSGDTGDYAASFLMGGYNAQVVRLSNALQGWRYGRGFRYGERHDGGRGVLGAAKALGMAAMLPVLVASLTVPGLKQAANKVLPAPGEGPSEKARAKGHFRVEVHADTTSGRRVVATAGARRDPGYGGTAVMIAQAALALAAGEGMRVGVGTPAATLGLGYAERLREQGFMLEAHATS